CCWSWGKCEDEVKKVIEGENGFMCKECVESWGVMVES
ncbi:ClpX C4-type zinc finger protein, partial [Neisseria sicca]